MANKEVTVCLPVLENTQSVEIGTVTKTAIDAGDVVTIKGAFENRNDTTVVIIEAAGTHTLKAGNGYPNKMLGDLNITTGDVAALNYKDIARFENRDGSIVITAGAAGNIYAVANRAGIKPVA